MPNTKLDLQKTFQLVMECRQSGMSDRQWCIEHDIHPSTFYYWVKRLRDHACYEVPENNFHNSSHVPACVVKQDVVKVNVVPDETQSYSSAVTNGAPVVIQYQKANVLVQDNFNPNTLKDVLAVLKEALC